MRPALADVRRVLVGSANAPKVEAVRSALSPYAPAATVAGVGVASGVPDQPVGWDEITRGASNRARAAAEAEACDLAVGLEDGLVHIPGRGAGAFNVGCAAIQCGGRESVAYSSAFAYPPVCTGPAERNREPIGELFDALYAQTREARDAVPSGRGVGNIGRLSGGELTRSEYARHAVVCALLPFLHPDWYPEDATP